MIVLCADIAVFRCLIYCYLAFAVCLINLSGEGVLIVFLVTWQTAESCAPMGSRSWRFTGQLLMVPQGSRGENCTQEQKLFIRGICLSNCTEYILLCWDKRRISSGWYETTHRHLWGSNWFGCVHAAPRVLKGSVQSRSQGACLCLLLSPLHCGPYLRATRLQPAPSVWWDQGHIAMVLFFYLLPLFWIAKVQKLDVESAEIIERFELEGTCKGHLIQSPAMSRDIFNQKMLLRAPFRADGAFDLECFLGWGM